VGSFKPSNDLDKSELAAWTTIASMLLNLDETVTKDDRPAMTDSRTKLLLTRRHSLTACHGIGGRFGHFESRPPGRPGRRCRQVEGPARAAVCPKPAVIYLFMPAGRRKWNCSITAKPGKVPRV